jgi:REP element-mobilizing transposase RayT
MKGYDPNKHHRRSIRLRNYDYRQPGAYFVTINTHGGERLFDDPVLRDVAEAMWQRLPRHFPSVELDEWVVMPNHLHGILCIVDRAPMDGARPEADVQSGARSGSLGAIVGNFKSVVTRRINRIRGTPGVPVWQRNYYERVIRNERELAAIRKYIRDNPADRS